MTEFFKHLSAEFQKKRILTVATLSLIAFWIACCGSPQGEPTNPSVSGEGSGRVGATEAAQTPGNFDIIPTPDQKSADQKTYLIETYIAENLALCTFHQFDESGKALAPVVVNDCVTEIDLDNNLLTIDGDFFAHADSELFPFEQGEKTGYGSVQTMTVEEVKAWVDTMKLDNQEIDKQELLIMLDKAILENVDVRVMLKTFMNIGKDDAGQDKFLNMDLALAFTLDKTEANTTVLLRDNFSPLTENALLKDKNISEISISRNTGLVSKVEVQIYPKDWIEIGDSVFVSPEYVHVLDSTTDSFSLGTDGVFQFQSRKQGVIPVKGVEVLPNGMGQIILDKYEATFDPDGIVYSTGLLTFVDDNKVQWEWSAEKELTRVEIKISDEAKKAIDTMTEWRIDPTSYTCDEFGTCKNLEGVEVFKGGRIDFNFLMSTVTNYEDLKPTEFEPNLNGSVKNAPPANLIEYSNDLMDRMDENYAASHDGALPFDMEKAGFTELMINEELLAWGVVEGEYVDGEHINQYLIIDLEGGVAYFPILQIKPILVSTFWR